ncbi:MAG: hypothetical protein PVH69_09165 [Desulfobacterales bacterium]|jgi:hypothetical protein
MGKLAKVLVGILIFAALCVLVYVNVMKWHKKTVQKAITDEQQTWQEKTEGLAQRVAGLEKKLSEAEGPAGQDEKLTEALGQRPADAGEGKPILLADVDAQVKTFFTYLDQQPYIKAYKLKGGAYQQYDESVDLLSKNEPVLVGETDSLHRLFKNMAHLYRVLGKQRISLIKSVLDNEYEIIEPVMRTFYRWYTLEGGSKTSTAGRPSPKVLYAYSCYFLNTISGRSYLLRRDSKIRVLTYFYCVKFIDLANTKKLNSLGIDIRPLIKTAYQDIRNQMGLSSRKVYLGELEQLDRKYSAP